MRAPRTGSDVLDCSFFFNDTATTEIYTLSLHDALPISSRTRTRCSAWTGSTRRRWATRDRKSTRLNSSHGSISYAVFCLTKKTTRHEHYTSEFHSSYDILYCLLPSSIPT